MPGFDADKLKHYSDAAANYATDDDGASKSLTFALLALTQAVLKAGQENANLSAQIMALSDSVSSLDAEVEKLRLNAGR